MSLLLGMLFSNRRWPVTPAGLWVWAGRLERAKGTRIAHLEGYVPEVLLKFPVGNGAWAVRRNGQGSGP